MNATRQKETVCSHPIMSYAQNVGNILTNYNYRNKLTYINKGNFSYNLKTYNQ